MASLSDKEPDQADGGAGLPASSEQNGCRPKRRTKIAQRSGKRDHGLCAVCHEIGHSSVTASYCFDCGRTMCETCDQNHQQISAFKAHAKVSLRADGSGHLCPKRLEALTCRDHDRMVRKYCTDCQRPVCNACLARKHHRHTIKTFAIKTEVEKKCFNELQALLRRKMAELDAKMEQLESIKEKHQENFRMVEQMISGHAENLYNQVNAQNERLQAELDSKYNEKRAKLRALVDQATMAQQIMTSLGMQARIAQIRKAEMEFGNGNKNGAQSEADQDEAAAVSKDSDKADAVCESCSKETSVCECPDQTGSVSRPLDKSEAVCDGVNEMTSSKGSIETVVDSKSSSQTSDVSGEPSRKATKGCSCCDDPTTSQDLDTIIKNHNFELVPDEDPDVTLAHIQVVSTIVGNHIDAINQQVEQTKEEIASIRIEFGPTDIQLGKLVITPGGKLDLFSFEKELDEIRQLADRLKADASSNASSDSVSVTEVSLRDTTGAICENPFK